MVKTDVVFFLFFGPFILAIWAADRLRTELTAERERVTAYREHIVRCDNSLKLYAARVAKLREALEMARDGLNNGGFISDKNRAAIDAVLEETKGGGDE